MFYLHKFMVAISLVLRLIMMVTGALPLTLYPGIRVAVSNPELPLSGLLLTMPHCQAHLFPTWSVTHHASSSPVVGGPGPSFLIHFPDQDPVDQRPAKRFRITGKSSAHKRPSDGKG